MYLQTIKRIINEEKKNKGIIITDHLKNIKTENILKATYLRLSVIKKIAPFSIAPPSHEPFFLTNCFLKRQSQLKPYSQLWKH